MPDSRRHRDIEPAHPGEILDEIAIPATGRSKVEIASLLGISRQSLYDILGKRQSVTPQGRGPPRQAVRRWPRRLAAPAASA